MIRRFLPVVALSLAAFAAHGQTYFAEIDAQGIVKRVIVADRAFVNAQAGTWVQTAPDGSIGKNYAGIGHQWDAGRAAFIAPKPFASWVLDEAKAQWTAPTPMPGDGKAYRWEETTRTWQEVPPR